MRKFAGVAISLLLLVSGCQTTKISDADKQSRIETMYQQYAQEFPSVKEITARQLQQLQRQGQKLVLVDVRSPEEIAISYIPGAITAAEFESNLDRYRSATVIAYCTIGYRSGLYAEKLLQQQGIEVFNLAGSLLAWSHVNGSLTNGREDTRKVHVFGRQWQLTSSAYEPVW